MTAIPWKTLSSMLCEASRTENAASYLNLLPIWESFLNKSNCKSAVKQSLLTNIIEFLNFRTFVARKCGICILISIHHFVGDDIDWDETHIIKYLVSNLTDDRLIDLHIYALYLLSCIHRSKNVRKQAHILDKSVFFMTEAISGTPNRIDDLLHMEDKAQIEEIGNRIKTIDQLSIDKIIQFPTSPTISGHTNEDDDMLNLVESGMTSFVVGQPQLSEHLMNDHSSNPLTLLNHGFGGDINTEEDVTPIISAEPEMDQTKEDAENTNTRLITPSLESTYKLVSHTKSTNQSQLLHNSPETASLPPLPANPPEQTAPTESILTKTAFAFEEQFLTHTNKKSEEGDRLFRQEMIRLRKANCQLEQRVFELEEEVKWWKERANKDGKRKPLPKTLHKTPSGSSDAQSK
ncbi:hypothetical protein BLNAU_8637 [Blattamonas nauphoetae]|uniref:Uncharacterized protein n=1 Tax=Blattamonas nauphoetae TaxID=2049346 RepID=A0ABQ9XY72_9EUKA|nr:hypothetical protein BLNAU_8637 [Blattamonas nauphoetae]